MAGKLSTDLARRQGAHLNCAEFADLHPGDGGLDGGRRLKDYWAHGKGALKIRWGTDGSFRRCVRQLRKYFPRNPEGLCANLHHEATGEWPTEHGKLGIPS